MSAVTAGMVGLLVAGPNIGIGHHFNLVEDKTISAGGVLTEPAPHAPIRSRAERTRDLSDPFSRVIFVAGTPAKRSATSTSNFGVGRRENHDSSGFYERFTAPEISSDDTVAVAAETDRIWVHDARDMPELPDNSVALVEVGS